MYRAFNVESLSFSDLSDYREAGEALLLRHKRQVETDLDRYFSDDGELDAASIFEDWFPQVEADVFISHSHADEEQVYGLAGLLQQDMGLTAFVDSAVWGYSNTLLKRFDNKFCLSSGGSLYDYDKRNISTTHVHLMLNMSLLNMMDKTEAIFFYNTPNSVSLKDSVERSETSTYSPWIFSEISMTRMLRARTKQEHRQPIHKALLAFDESLESRGPVPAVRYPIELGHLIKVDNSGFWQWALMAKAKGFRGDTALDYLYELVDVK